MPEWLQAPLHEDVKIDAKDLLLRLVAAFLLGCVAAGIHRLTTRSGTDHGRGLLCTVVLLSVLIAMLTMVIGNSVARAFSLVGALAIVRFRTVVEDTRDTAFVIFAVATGMACGVGYVLAPVAVAPLVLLASLLFRPRAGSTKRAEQLLVLRLGTAAVAEGKVQALLQKRFPGCRLTELATARGGAALDLMYAIRPLGTNEALALVAELNGIEGVQSVELKGR